MASERVPGQGSGQSFGVVLNTVPEGIFGSPVPQVTVVHDLLPLLFPAEYPRQQYYFRFLVPRVLQASCLVIADSESTRRGIIQRFELQPEKVRVVYPGYDPDTYSPNGFDQSSRRYEDPYCLYALIEAYNLLRKKTSLTPLLVLVGGEGWKNRAIHRAAARSPFAADIKLLGHVPDEEIPALMNGAVVFVYPSVYEGFGMPPLEAMTCGTPVITSNVSSLPEVVGDAALLVDPADVTGLAAAMARMLEDQSLREDLQERGLKQARRFSWDETARRTLQVYESVHSSGSAASSKGG